MTCAVFDFAPLSVTVEEVAGEPRTPALALKFVAVPCPACPPADGTETILRRDLRRRVQREERSRVNGTRVRMCAMGCSDRCADQRFARDIVERELLRAGVRWESAPELIREDAGVRRTACEELASTRAIFLPAWEMICE